MYIKEVKVENFRNYESQSLKLGAKVNVLFGDNAQGKTNILEAIYFAAIGKSFRAQKDNEIVNFSKEFVRFVIDYTRSDDFEDERINKIEVFIDKNGTKQIKNNGIKVTKISEHIGEINIVMFSPESMDIVKGAPQKRRKFLDMLLCQISKSNTIVLQEYNKFLKMKNDVLKQDKNIIDDAYLDVLNTKLSGYIKKITTTRIDIIKKIEEKAKIIHESLTGEKESLSLNYISDFINFSEEEIKKKLDDIKYIEILRKSSIKGSQRDDLEIIIDGADVSKYGSQGQNRTALLSVKLAEFEVLKEVKDNNPILLLDDVMSELDNMRIEYLINYIKDYQSVITTTDIEIIKKLENVTFFKISGGQILNM